VDSLVRKEIGLKQWTQTRFSMSSTNGTPFMLTNVFGLCVCLRGSLVLWCGQAKQQWNGIKAQKTGKHTNLGSDKTKKQSIICAAFVRQKNETQWKHAQQAGVLWSDEDFENCQLDEFCQGNITEEVTI
jgi:hypothetical protein